MRRCTPQVSSVFYLDNDSFIRIHIWCSISKIFIIFKIFQVIAIFNYLMLEETFEDSEFTENI